MRPLTPLAAATLAILGACGRDFHFADSASELNSFDPNYEFVSVRGLPDSDVGALARFRDLQSVDLAGGWGVRPLAWTSAGFARLAQLSPPKLRTLNVSYSPSVDDACLAEVGRLPTLACLVLRESTGFGRDGLAHILALPHLDYLDLRGCTQIDDGWLELLSTNGSITQLGVTSTSMSADGVARLRAALPTCHVDDDVAYINAVLDRAQYPGWGGPPERKGR